MKALVTGSSGFLGRSLSKLIAQDQITSLSLRNPSADWKLSSPYDVAEIIACLEVVEPDVIFHTVGLMKCGDPREFFRLNFHFANSLMSAVHATGGRQKVILMGSAAEYGSIDLRDLPVTESSVAKPQTIYGRSKLAQTELGLIFRRIGLDVITVRAFNIFGIGQSSDFVVGKIVNRLLSEGAGEEGAVLELGFTGAYRDFCDVDDVSRTLIAIARTDQTFPEVLNICTGKATKIDHILEYVKKRTGSRVRINSCQSSGSATSDSVYGSNELLTKSLVDISFQDVYSTIDKMIEFREANPLEPARK
jgi:nucleoside-diphosphate-sugar epimerase